MPLLNRRLLNSTALTNISLISAGMIMVASPALANPTGGQVIGGQATITQSAPNTLTINQQTNSAAINWQAFSIGKNETTNFVQPNSSSIAFNRVTGVNPSDIQGHLNANGQVVLVNPNGILFSKNAQVNVGGLVASTSGITEQNAIDGKMVFDQGSNAGAKIVNDGHISAKQGGLVALVSPSVINNGVITAKLGKVSLAAGDKWTLDLYGDKLVSFALNDKVQGEVSNAGVISANGGSVQLTANVAKDVVNNAINMSGLIEANSVSSQGGTILLAADGGTVSVTGKLEAKGTTGGTVQVTGDAVVLDGATINASGVNGGGTIDIGGEAHGGGTLAHAQSVTVDSTSKLIANAKTAGNGGTVSVWSDGATKFAGSASAKGGSTSGNGGTVETSGKNLDFSGAKIDTTAAAGHTGTWLLDPADITIDAAAAQTLENALGTVPATGTTNVIVDTGTSGAGTGNINVTSSVLWNTDNSLTLSAYNDIDVNASIVDSGAGNIVLRADNTGKGAGSVNIPLGTGTVQTGGAVSIYYDPTGGYTAPVNYVSIQNGGNVGGGNGAFTAYMLVNNASDLSKVSTNLAGNYALGANISSVGAFTPIGNGTTAFSGIFDGNGGIASYTIDGLQASGTDYVGLFGNSSGTIRNVTLTNAVVSGTHYVGSLIGYNTGTLTNNSSTNVVVSSTNFDNSLSVGGLVGYNGVDGFISGGSVTGNVYVGALTTDGGGYVGTNYGTIVGGSFTGTVMAGCVNIGGFVGHNYDIGLITGASAAAYVTNGGTGSAVGGFAGLNDGRLYNDTATQAVATSWANGNSEIGGFVGENSSGGTIIGGYVQGAVIMNDGNLDFGGFVGYNTGKIESSTSDVSMTIGNNVTDVGGFAGYNAGDISNNIFVQHAINAGTNSTNVGGYVGNNSGGTLSGVSIVGGYVSAGDASTSVGGIVGYNHGTLANDGYSGEVIVGSDVGVGGAVGVNFGVVEGVNVNGAVYVGDGTQFGGGVIGANFGGVSDSSFEGTVGAGCNYIGGFVGGNFGTITNSFATGQVSNYGGGQLGGFAGENATATYQNVNYVGLLQNDAAVNSNEIVSAGNEEVGGFVGYNNATIIGGFSTGSVNVGPGQTSSATPSVNVGGFAGQNDTTGIITNALTSDTVYVGYAGVDVGGFAGKNSGSISVAETLGAVSVGDSSSNVGGLVGYNNGSIASAAVSVNVSNLIAGSISTALNNSSYTGSVGSTISTHISTPNAPYGIVTGIADAVVVGSASTNVGGYIGNNVGASISGVSVSEAVSVGDSSQNIGGFVGQNSGNLSGNNSSGNVTAGANVSYVGGGVGFNDANGTVTGLSVSAMIDTGANSTGVGGIVGLNGGPSVPGAAQNDAVVSNSSFAGSISVGDNSFAVGGLVGWDAKWTDTNGVVHYGIIDDATVTGSGSVSSPANGGTTFIHSANQDGCDERAGGNCFGIAGQEAITISPKDLTLTYNGSAPVLSGNEVTYTFTVPGQTGTVNGLESGDLVGDTIQVTLSPELNGNAGTYVITGMAVIDTKDPTKQANALLDYAVSFNPNGSTITINKANVTVTPTGSQTYGGTNVQVSYGYQGLQGSDQGSVISGLSYSTNATALSPVAGNPYTITALGGTAQNYNVIDETGVYTVNKANVTVTPTGSQTYGGTNVQVSYGYQGLVGTDQGTVVSGLSYSTNATALSSVAGNPYTITALGGTASNYNVIDETGVYTVNKANVTVTPTGSQTYGGGNVQVSYGYQGLIASEQGQGNSLITGLSYSTNATPTSTVAGNPYTITALGGMAANYNVIDKTGVYTVNKAAVTISATGSQTYGGTNVQVSYGYQGLVAGDSSSLITGLSYTTNATAFSPVAGNPYTITGTGASATNYSIVYTTGAFTVNKADVTVTPTGSQTYGGTNVQVSYGYQGLVGSDKGTVVSGLSYSTNATASSSVAGNPYTITALGGTASNYNVIDETGVYTVNKANVTVTPTGSQTYGGTNVQVSYGYQGLVGTDQGTVVSGLSYSTNATALSPVAGNPYTITALGGTASNYNVIDETGVYTVNKANVTVTPTGSQTYGGTNVQVSYGYQGLVGTDQGTVVSGLSYSTNATALSSVAGNPYTITALGGTASNYNVIDETGVYTVNKANVTVTPTGSQTYGGTNVQVSYGYQGLVGTDQGTVVSGLSYSTNATALSSVAGNPYTITALGGNGEQL